MMMKFESDALRAKIVGQPGICLVLATGLLHTFQNALTSTRASWNMYRNSWQLAQKAPNCRSQTQNHQKQRRTQTRKSLGFSPAEALAAFRTQYRAYIKGEDPFNRKMRSNESALDWWKALRGDELANILAVRFTILNQGELN